MTLPPPLLLVGLVALEVGLSMAVPRPRIFPADAWSLLGAVPVAVGVWLHVAADRAFAGAETTRATRGLPRVLVTDGVYGRTRNPMYLGGALFLLGLALALGAAVTLVVPLLYVVLAHRLYIGPEEEVLERRFGLEWRAYRSRVRRWI